MNIIFLGGFFPESYTHSIIQKSKLQIQNAANNFQWAFIKGLEQNLKMPIKLITAPYIGWYPKYYKDIFIPSTFFSNNHESGLGIMVGFINLPFIKNSFKFINIRLALKHFIDKNNENVIIVYSYDWAYLKAALKAKKKFQKTKVCVIITDCYDWKEQIGFFNKISIKKYLNAVQLKLIYKADCFVVLTDQMIEYLQIKNKPWVRIEGIYSENLAIQNKFTLPETSDQERIILYTGTLEYPYGIEVLLDAFNLIKLDNYRLWICGSGSGKNLVKQRLQKDERITYFGIVGKEKIAELQAKATILVNPRNTIGEYNKYSFPSKTMEYFASGTPTLLYPLEGIPKEYLDFCFTIKDNKVESLSKAIIDTCQLSRETLELKGKSAKEFILKYKTGKIQCSKVLKMLCELS